MRELAARIDKMMAEQIETLKLGSYSALLADDPGMARRLAERADELLTMRLRVRDLVTKFEKEY